MPRTTFPGGEGHTDKNEQTGGRKRIKMNKFNQKSNKNKEK